MTGPLHQEGKLLVVHCCVCIQDGVQREAVWWRKAKDSTGIQRSYALCNTHKSAALPPRSPTSRATV